MKRDNSNKGLLPIILSILVTGYLMMCWPQKESRAQQLPDTTRAAGKPPAIDSAAIIREQRMALDSINLVKARELSAMTKHLNNIRARKFRKVEADRVEPQPAYALRIGGDLYEVEPDKYRGYLVFDIDSMQNEIEIDNALENVPPPLDTVLQHYTDQRNGLQKAIDFISKPFRKKNK